MQGGNKESAFFTRYKRKKPPESTPTIYSSIMNQYFTNKVKDIKDTSSLDDLLESPFTTNYTVTPIISIDKEIISSSLECDSQKSTNSSICDNPFEYHSSSQSSINTNSNNNGNDGHNGKRRRSIDDSFLYDNPFLDTEKKVSNKPTKKHKPNKQQILKKAKEEAEERAELKLQLEKELDKFLPYLKGVIDGTFRFLFKLKDFMHTWPKHILIRLNLF